MAKLWTPPPTFVDGKKLRTGELNTYGRDNLEALRNRPGAMSQFASAASLPKELTGIAKGQWVAIPQNQERRDSGTIHNNESNNTRLTVPPGAGGLWFLAAGADLFAEVQGPRFGESRHVGLRVNGWNVIAVWSAWPSQFDVQNANVSTLFPLVPGDYVELVVWHDSTNEYSVTNVEGRTPELRAQYLCELFAGYVPAWHALKTWADDEVLDAADLNDQLRDNPGWLRYRPAFAMAHVVPESVPNNAWTSLLLGLTRGQNGVWNGTANTATVPAGCGGLYLLGLTGRMGVVGGGTDRAMAVIHNATNRVLVKNLTGFAGLGIAAHNAGVTRLIRLAAGDTLRLQAFQNSGAAVDTSHDGFLSQLAACWMAP